MSERLAEKFVNVVRATIKGSGVVAIVQGALGAITFALVGLPAALLWRVLMAIAALLPAIGPAIVWGPVAIYLFAIGSIWQAVVVIVSGVLVIGLFCAVATWIILKLIDATIGLRVSRDEETEGLDTALHGERVQ